MTITLVMPDKHEMGQILEMAPRPVADIKTMAELGSNMYGR